MNFNTQREPNVYVKTVLTFGDKPAPAITQTALRKTAEEKRDEYPEAAETLTKNSYMDDIFDSVDTVKQANKLTQDIDTVLESGGFAVKGWTSNNAFIETQNLERGLKIAQEEREGRVLGLVWNCNTDEFRFKVKLEFLSPTDPSVHLQPKITKRRILSQVDRIYDPIGFAASFIIRAKIGMQELWQLRVNWDDELPCNVQEKWIQSFTEMKELDGIGFKRCLVPPETDELLSLCVFAYASQEAFGACAYIRQKTKENTYEVTFVTAK